MRHLFAASGLMALSLLLSSTAEAQEAAGASAESDRISDNSFLIEEAYNQEAGVVQHINTMYYDWKHDTWDYTFTQEWPVFSQTHQFSYTLPVSRVQDPESNVGVGDLMLNYRYQLVNREGVALAPRATLIVPTGDYKDGLGSDSVGYQFNLPISVDLNDKFVSHWNIGMTINPDEHDSAGNSASTTSFNYGASLIYLMSPTFNLMLEAAGNASEVVGEGDTTSQENSFFVNPGMRFAVNFESGLQIVPGLAFPIGIGPSEGDYGVFGYLSFEHPF